MKKLLSILLLFAVSATMTVKAQSIGKDVPVTMYNTWGQYQPSGTPSIAVDSIRTFYLYTGPILGYKDAAVIQATATKTSGTMTGSATLQVSSDGIGWADYTSSLDTTSGKVNNFLWTLVNNTTPQTYRWKLTDVVDKYFRLKLVTTAVSVSTVTANYSAAVRIYH